MSAASKPVSASRQGKQRQPNPTDKILGCFSNVPQNPTLDHLVRYFSTWSGTDKLMMITQYSSKLLIAFLTLQHALRIRLRHGTKGYHAPHGGSSIAKKLEKLSSLISDARCLYRIWGILPILKWMIALEKSPPPTRLLHNIERIQGWSMILYCPLEAVAYLASHNILNISQTTQNKLWLTSARAWAVYVMLQLLHLVEDNRLLRLRAKALERSRGHPSPPSSSSNVTKTSEKGLSAEQVQTRRMWDELDTRKAAILNEFWVNLGYMPLTIHWYVGLGSFLVLPGH